ncbi:hypothetical protein O3P69_009069 [Scylla paramamosain]|uniref:Uncharacterized protein n=1 Tax=Scylla paramamosain TaxID=85552 RepID=A0AAW0TR84_SCYPA
MLMRLKMMVKLAKLLGRDTTSSSSTSSKRRPRKRVIDTRAKPSAKLRQARILNKMRSALGRKPRKSRKPKSFLWERAQQAVTTTGRGRPTWDLLLPENVEPENEPEITIELTSKVERPRSTFVIYNFTSGYFEEVVEDEPLLDLLTLHSSVTLKEDLDKALHRFGLQWSDSEADSSLEQLAEDSRRELEEVYRGVVTREELARIDMQPNPFNYSDRVSQTTPNPTKVMQHNFHNERRLKTL